MVKSEKEKFQVPRISAKLSTAHTELTTPCTASVPLPQIGPGNKPTPLDFRKAHPVHFEQSQTCAVTDLSALTGAA